MNIENKVIQALKTVDDPDLKKDLVTLNMIKDLKINDNIINFTLELTTPVCPLKDLIKNNCIKAIKKYVSSDFSININITSRITSNKSNIQILPKIKNIIAIASGKGGVGKSTVTSNIAISLASSGAKVGILDADISGPSIPILFNCQNEKPEFLEIDGKNYIIPIEQYGIKLMSIGFVANEENAVLWRGPMASSAIRQFLLDTSWGELDYLFIDLPPGTSDIHLTLVQTVKITGVLIITTPQKVAIIDAVKGLAMFEQKKINVPIIGILENKSYFSTEDFPDKKYYIFGKDGGKFLAKRKNIPFLGQIPIIQNIRESGDIGYPISMKYNSNAAKIFTNISSFLSQQIAIINTK